MTGRGAGVAGRGTGVAGRGTGVAGRGAAVGGRGTGVAGRGTAVAGRGTGAARRGTGVAGRGTAVARRGTAVARRGTAVARRGTAVAGRGAAVAGRGTAVARRGAGVAGRGAKVLWGGLLALTAIQLTVGCWQLFAPRSFYGVLWVSDLPPYNEHMMRDLGASSLAIAVVLAAGVRAMEPRLVSVGLAAYLTFSVPHLVFHSAHLEHMTAGSAATLMALLGAGAIGPSWLLWLSVRVRTARPAPLPSRRAARRAARRSRRGCSP
ncbi:hypothetical protein [Streptomyces sp. NPDC002855]|uniref:hypothetical protein n=1 Tax=Streptomyces sp. NPDC002855 TaxID=3154437 RepID=UPI003326DD1E